jgi:voltage-gated potassium channel Kch
VFGRVTQFIFSRFERALETGRILPYMFFLIAAITVAYGVLMRIVDPHDFPTVGLAIWWAAETVTTIGYGDVVPTTSLGKLVAAGLMIFGFASLSLLAGIVASVFVHRRESAGARPEIVAVEERLAEIERLLREKS